MAVAMRSQARRLLGPAPLSGRRALGLAVGALPAVCAFAVTAAAAIADGAYDATTYRLITVALLALAAAALIARDRIVFGAREWTLLLAFAGLAGWIAVSRYWSIDSLLALPEFERTAVYLAILLAILVGASRSDAPKLAAGLLAGITFGSLTGLVPYL